MSHIHRQRAAQLALARSGEKDAVTEPASATAPPARARRARKATRARKKKT